jgi:hypothetical protein
MPFGIGLGSIAGLARDVRSADEVPLPIRVFGPRADELARALAAGAAAGAALVQELGDAAAASALVCVIDGDEPGPSALAPLRAGSRTGIPLVAVRLDGTERSVPYVLAMDVVGWTPGAAVPVDRVADRLARRLQRRGRLFAAVLPALRPAVERTLGSNAAVRGAAFVALPFGGDVHLPVLSFLQARMLLDLETADGGNAPYAPDEVALALGPRLALSVGLGLAARTVHRALPPGLKPIAGPLFAYGGTRALAAAAPRLPLPR